MNSTKLFIKFTLMISILLSVSNLIVEKSSSNNRRVIIAGTIIGLKTEIEIKSSNEIKDGKLQTSKQNIGIMTCIDLDTSKYVAFGHSITTNKQDVEVSNGKCYEAKPVSIQKAKNFNSGSIKAALDTSIQYGDITQNTNCGIYGNITNISELIYNKDNVYSVASRVQIQKGNAEIFINLDGTGLKSYDIEILDIDYFKQNQNIHIKVIDKELLKVTGGIVKGMSGTPIIQNGKLIGAINYVLEANPVEGYAIFADKLFYN